MGKGPKAGAGIRGPPVCFRRYIPPRHFFLARSGIAKSNVALELAHYPVEGGWHTLYTLTKKGLEEDPTTTS